METFISFLHFCTVLFIWEILWHSSKIDQSISNASERAVRTVCVQFCLMFSENIYGKCLIVANILPWFDACNMAIGQISTRRVYYSSAIYRNPVFSCEFHALLFMVKPMFWHTWYSCMQVIWFRAYHRELHANFKRMISSLLSSVKPCAADGIVKKLQYFKRGPFWVVNTKRSGSYIFIMRDGKCHN